MRYRRLYLTLKQPRSIATPSFIRRFQFACRTDKSRDALPRSARAQQRISRAASRREARARNPHRRRSAIGSERSRQSDQRRWLVGDHRLGFDIVCHYSNGIWVADRNCPCRRTSSWSARSKASAGSTCTRWSTPSAPTASAFCTFPNSPRPRSRSCTTTWSRSTPGSICRSAPC